MASNGRRRYLRRFAGAARFGWAAFFVLAVFLGSFGFFGFLGFFGLAGVLVAPPELSACRIAVPLGLPQPLQASHPGAAL